MSQKISQETQEIQKEIAQGYIRMIDFGKSPNYLLVFVQPKIKDNFKAKGSGCLISDKYVLTAAHNFSVFMKKKGQIKNNKQQVKDESLIYHGQSKCQFTIKQHHLYSKYQQNQKADYIILQLTSKHELKKEQQFMPIVALSQTTMKQLQLQLLGYPIKWSQQNKPQNINETISYVQPVQLPQSVITTSDASIHCGSSTEYGFSGGPLVAFYKNQFVIIGIHKAGNKSELIDKNKGPSIAVNACYMLEQLNQLGYERQKKAFVYTEKTFQYKNVLQKVHEQQTLSLINKDFQPCDILVFTAFDLTKMTKILLCGNNIGCLGVEYLLRRNYPNLKYLFLIQNDIEELPKENWSHVKNLQILKLNLNLLRDLPQGLKELQNLKELSVGTNLFETIPEVMKVICQKTKIHIYNNLIDQQAERQTISRLERQRRIEFVWQIEQVGEN